LQIQPLHDFTIRLIYEQLTNELIK